MNFVKQIVTIAFSVELKSMSLAWNLYLAEIKMNCYKLTIANLGLKLWVIYFKILCYKE